MGNIGLYYTILGPVYQSKFPEENRNSFSCSNPEQYLAMFFTIFINIQDNISQYWAQLDNIVSNLGIKARSCYF